MNLALLRVCAAVMIMNALYNSASLLFNRFYAEMTGDIKPLGFFIASLLLCVIIFALGTVALVKQNVLVLKIYAVCVVVSILGGTVVDIMNFNRLPLGVSYSHLFNSLLERIMNPLIVFIAAVFLIKPKKATQFGLLQFCAAYFLVDGLKAFFQSIVSLFSKGVESFSIVNETLFLFTIAVGVFAIVKRNSLVLKIYAVITVVQMLWGSLGYMRENMYGGYYVANTLIGLVFSSFLAVCAATFFIEPEKTRDYFQKAKGLFTKWKEMT